MEMRECEACGQQFAPKYDWSKLCWPCWWDSPQGKAFKEKKDSDFKQSDDSFKKAQEQHKQKQDEARSSRYRHDAGRPEGVARGKMDIALLRKLLQLCHPDKHGGSALANSVTMELLKMKEELR